MKFKEVKRLLEDILEKLILYGKKNNVKTLL